MSFADSAYQKGDTLGNVWGFVDGTLRGIASPSSKSENNL